MSRKDYSTTQMYEYYPSHQFRGLRMLADSSLKYIVISRERFLHDITNMFNYAYLNHRVESYLYGLYNYITVLSSFIVGRPEGGDASLISHPQFLFGPQARRKKVKDADSEVQNSRSHDQHSQGDSYLRHCFGAQADT